MNVLSSGAGMGMMGTIIWIAVLLVFIKRNRQEEMK